MELRSVTDQMGRRVMLPVTPERVISLVPSQTEFLMDIGLDNRLVGRTRFCIHPIEVLKSVADIGGTKKLNLERIRSLKPDLIIGNKEENERAQIETLEQEFPVWMSDIISLDDTYSMMSALGNLCNLSDLAESYIRLIQTSIGCIKQTQYRFRGLRVLYAIWRNPWMFAGPETFIHTCLQVAGMQNVCPVARYPELNAEEVLSLNPDLILLSSEPYPFSEKHIREVPELFGGIPALLVDGEQFSWYGSRLLGLEDYLSELDKKNPGFWPGSEV